MPAIVNVNGTITDDAHAAISVFDDGFLYGEGVYGTLRTYRGRVRFLDRHLRRLRNSAGMIALDEPFTDDRLSGRIAETIERASATAPRETEWYIRWC